MRRASTRVLFVGLLAASAAPAGATVLLFDQERDAASRTTVQPASSGGRLPGDYGDNVTGFVHDGAGLLVYRTASGTLATLTP